MTKRALAKMEPGGLLADRAYETLVRAILTEELMPGAALSVPELARSLDVSRSPVREAVQRLINDGLAMSVPRRGAVVSEIHHEDFENLFEVREPLEGLAASRAAVAVTDADLSRLQGILDEHDRVLREGDQASQIELDMEYHRTIRDVAGNLELCALLNRIQMRSHLALITLWRQEASSRLSLEEHAAIQAALQARDPAAADSAAREHIRSVRARMAQSAAAPSGGGGGHGS